MAARTRLLAVILVLLGATVVHAQERMTMALTGDSIITRKLSVYQEPEFLDMIELIRGADVAFTNIEMLFHDYEPYPMASSGGTYMRAQPEMAKELVWAGFDLGSLANNHAGDYGVEGMLLTQKYVREAGITAAGTGRSLAEAREAKFLETASGRVAFISVSSSFPDHSVAGASRDDIPARPGLNPLRNKVRYVVSRERLEDLRALMSELSMDPPAEGDKLRFRGNDFEVGSPSAVITEADPGDVAAIGAVVRNASRLADYTIVTIHTHQGPSRMVPPDFLVDFARAMVDEGADVFVGHGPHALRAIELYKGKPIMYSLGDFMFQNETLQRLPYENYARYELGDDKGLADFNAARYQNDTTGFPAIPEIWEAVIAVPAFEGGDLVELRLHPIDLKHRAPPTVRGRPVFADDTLSRKIIDDVKRLSEPYGTEIDFVNGVGVVRLGARTSNE